MNLNTYAKSNINKILKQSSFDAITYQDFFSSNKFSYSDCDVLEYLVALAKKELLENKFSYEKYSENISFSILIFLSKCQEDAFELNEELIKNIYFIANEYFKLSDNNCDFDNNIMKENFNSILSIINESYFFVICEENNEDTKEKLNKLKEALIEKNKIITEQQNNEKLLKSSILKSNLEVEQFNKLLSNANIKYDELQAEFLKTQKKLEKIEKEKDDFFKQHNFSLNEIEIILDEYIKSKKLKDQNDKVETIILNALFQKGLSIIELKQLLDKNKISLTNNEIYNFLQTLKTRISISNIELGINSPIYKITVPDYDKTNKFSISLNQNQKYLDILLVSDFHFTIQDEIKTRKIFNLYDYCTRNSINYIFNLGDIFDLLNENTVNIDYYTFKKIENFIDKVSDCFPKDTGIYHCILGGNHDQIAFKYGINILDRLCETRYDLISLGYEHCLVNIGPNQEKILLHHPNQKFIFPNNINKIGIDPCYYLNDFYKKSIDNNYIDKNSICFNFLGHLHRTAISPLQNYCFVPSYFKDNYINSALHVRLYFNSDKYVNLIEITQLTQENDLLPINETFIQRNLK